MNSVISIVHAKEFAARGFDQKAEKFYHCAGDRCELGEYRRPVEGTHPEIQLFNKNNNTYAAFNLSELGDMLPASLYYTLRPAGDDWCMRAYVDVDRKNLVATAIAGHEVSCRAKLVLMLDELTW